MCKCKPDLNKALETIQDRLTDVWGERCPDHEPGCPICDAWAHFDAICDGFDITPDGRNK